MRKGKRAEWVARKREDAKDALAWTGVMSLVVSAVIIIGDGFGCHHWERVLEELLYLLLFVAAMGFAWFVAGFHPDWPKPC